MPIQFLPSGIKSTRELALVEIANQQLGITQPILVDIHQLSTHVLAYKGNIALDSGAFHNFRKGTEMSVQTYYLTLQPLDLDRFIFIANLDVIGDPDKSLTNFFWLRDKGIHVMPIWGIFDDVELLAEYHNMACTDRPLIGIGGLAGPLRDKAQRDETLRHLQEILRTYPGRYHLFGMHWIKGIQALIDDPAIMTPCHISMDSSTWLRGRKYRMVAFRNSITGKLSQAPARAIPAYKEMADDGDKLSVESLANIQLHFDTENVLKAKTRWL